MSFIYALFFGAGASAVAYSTLAKRVGYSNSKNIFTFIAAIFVFSTFVFYTIIAFIIN
jgi:hypothetical protein